jgi:hypothetical protein
MRVGRGKIAKNKALYYTYLDAKNLENHKSVDSGTHTHTQTCRIDREKREKRERRERRGKRREEKRRVSGSDRNRKTK